MDDGLDLDSLSELHPVWQALLATVFTWGVTAAGAAGVFVARSPSRRLMDALLGFSAGVMIAASYFSLLAPAITAAQASPTPAWVPATSGFVLGAAFVWSVHLLLPHLHVGDKAIPQGLDSSWRRSLLLVLAITIHNIPEGLAIGVAFASAAAVLPGASVAGATTLAIGIGLQNFPEGLAVAAPLRREGLSRGKSFWYGQLSGAVEPIAGVVGASAVMLIQPLLPYALSFAAGAMIFVVVEELVPQAREGGPSDWATLGTITGFALMMAMDVGLS